MLSLSNKKFILIFVPSLAEGDRLPREVFSGVPLYRYDSREFSVEPAPHHQGGRL